MIAPALPDVMTLPEVAAFMKRSPKGILNAMAGGRFLPQPFAAHPYRWRGEDLARWYRGEYREALDKLRRLRRTRQRLTVAG